MKLLFSLFLWLWMAAQGPISGLLGGIYGYTAISGQKSVTEVSRVTVNCDIGFGRLGSSLDLTDCVVMKGDTVLVLPEESKVSGVWGLDAVGDGEYLSFTWGDTHSVSTGFITSASGANYKTMVLEACGYDPVSFMSSGGGNYKYRDSAAGLDYLLNLITTTDGTGCIWTLYRWDYTRVNNVFTGFGYTGFDYSQHYAGVASAGSHDYLFGVGDGVHGGTADTVLPWTVGVDGNYYDLGGIALKDMQSAGWEVTNWGMQNGVVPDLNNVLKSGVVLTISMRNNDTTLDVLYKGDGVTALGSLKAFGYDFDNRVQSAGGITGIKPEGQQYQTADAAIASTGGKHYRKVLEDDGVYHYYEVESGEEVSEEVFEAALGVGSASDNTADEGVSADDLLVADAEDSDDTEESDAEDTEEPTEADTGGPEEAGTPDTVVTAPTEDDFDVQNPDSVTESEVGFYFLKRGISDWRLNSLLEVFGTRGTYTMSQAGDLTVISWEVSGIKTEITVNANSGGIERLSCRW